MGFKLSSEARLQLRSSAWIKAQTRVILLAERKWEARLFCLHRVCQTRFPSFLWLDWLSVCYIVTVSSHLLSCNLPLLSCCVLHCCCWKGTACQVKLFCCCIVRRPVLSGSSGLSAALFSRGLFSVTKTTPHLPHYYVNIPHPKGPTHIKDFNLTWF